MQVALIVAIAGMMHAVRAFVPAGAVPGGEVTPTGTLLAAGYLFLTGYLAGSLFQAAGLPKLTGYLAAGLVTGPEILGLVSAPMVANLKIFNGVAIALIALTGGTEMHFGNLRPVLRSVGWITLIAVLGTTVLLAIAAFAMAAWLPFMAGAATAQRAAIACVLAVTMVAQSPAVVIALRDEMEADGPVSRTVLAVVVLADLVVILLFAVASSLARSLFGEGASALDTAAKLAWEILGSGLTGVAVGILFSVYLRKVTGSSALFVVTVCFVFAEVGSRVHFDPLLVALAAGATVRNLTAEGDRLHAEIEAASLPVYVAFFAVAGAGIHLSTLQLVGIPAAIFVAVRATGLQLGTRVAARIAEAPPAVARYAGFGLVPQAGLALALAIMFARTFPDFGAPASALVFGVVAINELLAPVLFRYALVKSGEAGQRRRESLSSPAVHASGEMMSEPTSDPAVAATRAENP